LGAKLEDLSYPAIYRKKIDEYLGEIENKINNLRKKKRVDIKFKRTGTYEQPKPVATIAVPKNYFKDPYAKLDFCEKEKDRIFDISFLLPNKLFRTFRTVLKTELFFKFWGSHIKAKKLTCFDKFAAYLGFTIEDKEFNYNASYGNDKGILITRASISWCEDIPMPKEEIKPFLNKTGGLWVVSDKHHK
jgi:hypothetical protein